MRRNTTGPPLHVHRRGVKDNDDRRQRAKQHRPPYTMCRRASNRTAAAETTILRLFIQVSMCYQTRTVKHWRTPLPLLMETSTLTLLLVRLPNGPVLFCSLASASSSNSRSTSSSSSTFVSNVDRRRLRCPTRWQPWSRGNRVRFRANFPNATTFCRP